MKLFMTAQAADRDDPALSVYLDWVRELAGHCESVDLVCLKVGEYDLPANVRVHSLGKESAKGNALVNRLRYTWRFYRYAFAHSRKADAVFVHMNQEYILLMGFFWKLMGKPVFMWRNHYAGTILTDIAASFCKKVFYTSRYSYTAKFKHSMQMPVGIDVERFTPGAVREHLSIVSLGRVAPSKRVDLLVSALHDLHRDGIAFVAHVYGAALPEDAGYMESLQQAKKEYGLDEVTFHGGVAHREVAGIMQKASIFVNVSRSGMLDKTIFEAAACGCLVLARSEDYHAYVDSRLQLTDDTDEELAQKLRALLSLNEDDAATIRKSLRDMVVREHSLQSLMKRLYTEFS